MSREIRRVPEGFDWPLDKVWEGYLMPDDLHLLPCPAGDACCNGTTSARAWVEEMAHLLLMLDDERPGRPMHPYFNSIPSHPMPSPDIKEFGTGLAGREGRWLGHDAIDRWQAGKKIIKAAGLKKSWGICPACEGTCGVDAYEGQSADRETWKPTKPPTGEWWQLWETISEGSPVTPAFETAESLALYMGENPRAGRTKNMTYEAILKWVTTGGWAPSLVVTSAGIKSGIEAMQ